MQIAITFTVDNVEEDINIEEFAEEIVSDIGDFVLPYHDVALVEVSE